MDFPSESVNIDDDDDDDDQEELKILESSAHKDNSIYCDYENPSKKSRTTTSEVWNNFSKVSEEKVKCNGCGKEYVWSGSKYGTSTLRRHTNDCKVLVKYQDVGVMLDNEGKLRFRKIDQKLIRERLSMLLILCDLLLRLLEYKPFRDFLNAVNPDVKCISRNTVTNDIWKLYLTQKDKLKHVLSKCTGRIFLTSDCWTACTSEGYICLTAHFVDENWKLNSKILSFCKMVPPHSGYELSKKVHDCLKDWRIDRKVFSLTLDNASANDNMQDILKQQLCLQNSLLCGGKFFHVRCYAHILNLIVQEGLKVASDALNKIRESIKYVKSSEGRMRTFHECVNQVGGIDTKVGLHLDVCIRWNSTYMMLESALKYRRAFSSLQLIDKNYKLAPSNEEWRKGEKMCEFLRPFYLITNMICGTSYPTSNLYFMQVWKVERLLKENMENRDDVIKSMAMRMKSKFDKYWSDYSVVLALRAILDPRLKLGMIKFCYSQLDPNTCQEKVDLIKNNLQMLFNKYSTWMSSTQSCGTSSSTMLKVGGKGKESTDEYGLLDVFKDYINNFANDSQNEKSALDIYLDETPLDLKMFPNMDVLEYWKNYRKRSLALSTMACDILSIPITTVASEYAFSIGGHVFNKFRSRLLGDHVQALICTRNWLQGFTKDDEDEVEVETLCMQGSRGAKEIVD